MIKINFSPRELNEIKLMHERMKVDEDGKFVTEIEPTTTPELCARIDEINDENSLKEVLKSITEELFKLDTDTPADERMKSSTPKKKVHEVEPEVKRISYDASREEEEEEEEEEEHDDTKYTKLFTTTEELFLISKLKIDTDNVFEALTLIEKLKSSSLKDKIFNAKDVDNAIQEFVLLWNGEISMKAEDFYL